MSSFKDQNYLHHYQYTKFQESDSDPFITCSMKRKCLAQTFQESTSTASNETTCLLLQNDLRSYADVVDNMEADGVNNYAKSIGVMISHARNANSSKQWYSGLKAIDPNKFLQLLEPPKCDLADNSGYCQSANITEDDINLLLANRNRKVASDDRKVKKSKPQENRFQSSMSQGPVVVHNSDGDLRRSNNNGWGNSCEAQNSKVSQRQGRHVSSHHSIPSTSSSHMCGDRGKFERSRFRGQGTVERTTMQPSNQGYHKENASTSHPGYDEPLPPPTMFTTAREQLVVQNAKKSWGSHGGGQGSGSSYGNRGYNTGNQGYGDRSYRGNQGCGDPQSSGNQGSRGPVRKVLGTRRTVMNKFNPPYRTDNNEDQSDREGKQTSIDDRQNEEVDERLKNIDPKMIELIRSEIMDTGAPVAWDDIAGLEFAKATIQEIVVWPLLRPDIFTGLRRPPKGILLFGPPGTGKTLIGKCIASQSCSTFFSISASSLTSKWIGDGEKMVRALFAVASCHQPAVVFIDEIDSLLTQRSDTEHESSRRIKTEFLVQLDGATTGEEDRTLVIGATNRPQELDEAARRRLVKRLYIPLPEFQARRQLVERLMSSERHSLTDANIDEVAQLTDGYSGADVKNLCKEASLGPIRSLGMMQIQHIQPDQVRGVNLSDFKAALTRVRASVSPDDLDIYVRWDKMFGSGGAGLQ